MKKPFGNLVMIANKGLMNATKSNLKLCIFNQDSYWEKACEEEWVQANELKRAIPAPLERD